MASHRAPSVRRPATLAPALSALFHGVTWAAPRLLRSAGTAVTLGTRLAWQGVKIAAALALAVAWVSLLLVLLTLSAVLPQGAELRRGVTAHMLQPLGEGARQALGSAPAAGEDAEDGDSTGVRAIRGLRAA